MSKSSYPVWAGVHPTEGWRGVEIGAQFVRDLPDDADKEQIYGSQIPHRCAALLPDGRWHLMTPTAAKRAGALRISY